MFSRPRTNIEWIVVCLGNPGVRYAGTRHNAGYLTGEEIARRKGSKLNRLKFHALTGECKFDGSRALILKPTTYMNLSGRAVQQAAAFHKIPPERVLVVSDDVALPLGAVRVRRKGSAGGHNGLKSIIQSLGTQDFPRIKIGVGMPPHKDMDMMDWVLGSFSGSEIEIITEAINRAADAVEAYITDGPDAAMKYNATR
jgi:PTH1 family peptidyl-tRNA hydrolase